MSEIKEYKTRQRTAIEEILRQSKTHVTADELVQLLEAKGTRVGRTTVYRALERLAEEGKVRKYLSAGDSRCYQYVNDDSCIEHFHLKCEKCGRLFHVECSRLGELSSHVSEHHGFTVNPLKTVLYGVCEKCSKQ